MRAKASVRRIRAPPPPSDAMRSVARADEARGKHRPRRSKNRLRRARPAPRASHAKTRRARRLHRASRGGHFLHVTFSVFLPSIR
ncbi:hypothetical protein C7S17_1503 [Burkholderia thailandensis]|nr:hypothetical protein [Burkholderia thailandensis]